jgi:adenosine deaminase
LTSIQIRQAQKNALECAFLTQAERGQLITRHRALKS